MIVANLCYEMKWTYDEYLDQPIWFVDLIRLKMQLEGEYQNKQK